MATATPIKLKSYTAVNVVEPERQRESSISLPVRAIANTTSSIGSACKSLGNWVWKNKGKILLSTFFTMGYATHLIAADQSNKGLAEKMNDLDSKVNKLGDHFNLNLSGLSENAKQDTFVAVTTNKSASHAHHGNITVDNNFIAAQRANLEKNTKGKGFGPQSPRDIDDLSGQNERIFGKAPPYSQMNLCNIHFHKNAEHKGANFSLYAGNGDGAGHNTGYRYSGNLTEAELASFKPKNFEGKADLQPGDTIELHYVHSSAMVNPNATLKACVHNSIGNPQLRVEAQVFVLVHDEAGDALNFTKLTEHSVVDGYHQAINIPNNTGTPIEYAGSATGSSHNEKASPFQVTWGVRPEVAKVAISTVYDWLKGNDFGEDRAHGVRNLVTNPKLLSSGK